MEFKSLTKANAAEYLGKPVIFKLNSATEKPMLAKLCKVKEEHFVIASNGTNYTLSVKHPVVVIVDISSTKKGKTESIHYPMNFLLASGITHMLPFVGHYAIVRTDNGSSVCLTKIRSISKCLQYMNVENGSSKQLVDIRNTTCYVIV
jgi:hypothetical protein